MVTCLRGMAQPSLYLDSKSGAPSCVKRTLSLVHPFASFSLPTHLPLQRGGGLGVRFTPPAVTPPAPPSFLIFFIITEFDSSSLVVKGVISVDISLHSCRLVQYKFDPLLIY